MRVDIMATCTRERYVEQPSIAAITAITLKVESH